MLPLYKELQNNVILTSYKENYNTGLWYNKFCNQWNDKNFWKLAERKIDWIKTVTNGKVGDTDKIKDIVQRKLFLVNNLGGEFFLYETQWRFVTGLGLEHPVENGFTWHHNLGVPYLPGSSVKGMVRAWAESNFSSNIVAYDKLIQIFGDEKKKVVGSVIFFDALPYNSVKLEVDVMTPHYSPYYNKGEALPGDWYNPEPIPFLTVAEGTNFVFSIAPRTNSEQNIENLELVSVWLGEALDLFGAGAKTASGYGRFTRNKALEEKVKNMIEQTIAKQKQEKLLASMSPIEREMEEDGYSKDVNAFMRVLTTKWLDAMEDESLPEKDRKEIAQLLAAWYQKFKKKDWENPKRKSKNEEKVKRIKAVLNK